MVSMTGLKRGMIATVHRPFSWRSPLWSLLAWRIRRHSGRILGHQATEHHAMIYAGSGEFWSQDQTFGLAPMKNYAGCRITFFDPPLTVDERERLLTACGAHEGAEYGYRDILGYWAWSITGSSKLASWISDQADWHCSEAACRLVRGIAPGAFGQTDCSQQTPQALYDWMLEKKWPVLEQWVD